VSLTFKIVDGDIPHGAATGRPLTLEGTPKFTQDLRQMLDDDVTPDGRNAGLSQLVGTVGDSFSLRAELTRRINEACAAFQHAQESVQRFDRLPEERFSRIALVAVFPLRDPASGTFSNTSFAYRADFLSQKGSPTTSITGLIAL